MRHTHNFPIVSQIKKKKIETSLDRLQSNRTTFCLLLLLAAAAAAIDYQLSATIRRGAPQCDKALKLIIDCHIAALVLSNLYRVIDFIATALRSSNYTPGKGTLESTPAHCLDSRGKG